MTNYDCVLVPGGGLLDDGTLPPWSVARLNLALSMKEQCRWIGLLSGGTVHKPPPLNAAGYPLFESRQAAAYLIDSGIHPEQILTEISSYDTIGNAYFSRLLFTEPLKLDKVLVITSVFHMPRTQALFDWIFRLPPVLANYELEYKSTENAGLTPEALAARVEREARSLANLATIRQKISNINDFTRWIYGEHKAYNLQQSPDPISEDELKSY